MITNINLSGTVSTEGSYCVLFVRFFVKVYFHGFAKAAAETAGKSSILVDQNANIIEEKKKIK